VRVVEGDERAATGPESRPPAPHVGGPLGSSGAAPGKPPGTPPGTPSSVWLAGPAAPALGAESVPSADQPGAPESAHHAVVEDPAPKPRRANPVRAVRSAGRSTSAWARRPAGRLIIPAIIALLLLGAAGTAGVYLVPEALKAAPTPSVTGFPFGGAAPALPAPDASVPLPGSPAPGAPVGPASGVPTVPGAPGARPADALAGWAQQVGTRAGIPVVAVEAYGYAELVLARSVPGCHLSWTTVAALASVESAHGSSNGAVLGADGSVQPPIYGLPLDGKGGRRLIRDTDHGTIDGDTTYDRAVGPLQFIPSAWLANAVDADNNGVRDPNDIDDASLTAAAYLCTGGRDLSKADSWWEAILSYNAVGPYAQKVFDTANAYGQRSRV
jgi:hypothetical protein